MPNRLQSNLVSSRYMELEDNIIWIEFVQKRGVAFVPGADTAGRVTKEQRLSRLTNYNEELKRAVSQSATTWSYSVTTKEYFSHLPTLVTNSNEGTIEIRKLDSDDWKIKASFVTPFLWTGLESNNVQTFNKVNHGTLLSEQLEYQCPFLLL